MAKTILQPKKQKIDILRAEIICLKNAVTEQENLLHSTLEVVFLKGRLQQKRVEFRSALKDLLETDKRRRQRSLSAIVAKIYAGKNLHALSEEEKNLVKKLEKSGYIVPNNPVSGFVGGFFHPLEK